MIISPLAALAFFLSVSSHAQASAADDRIKALEARLEKLETAPTKTSLSAFNPAMGLAVDAAFRSNNGKANVNVRAAELNLESPIDPYLKGWAIITGSNGGVVLEEAALETTALPYNLTVRGGRLFANFGRLAHFHDHELPVIDRPRSLDTYIGGETQADGLETQYLFPTERYVSATFGAYNKVGAGNARQDNQGSRALNEFTYLGRLNAYQDVGDDHSVELGVDSAWTPKRTVSAGAITTTRNTWRTLSGADLTYRYQPARGGLYKGLIWSTEVMRSSERRFDASTNLPGARVNAWSGFSYVELKTGRRLRGGFMGDLTQDLDDNRKVTGTYTAFLTCDVTEFQRLRLAYSEAHVNRAGEPANRTVGLQWTGVLGRHVHGFRDR
jgi:hypothetical protein